MSWFITEIAFCSTTGQTEKVIAKVRELRRFLLFSSTAQHSSVNTLRLDA